MIPYHDHNADGMRPGLVARLGTDAVALVSDAGTPLISDPGYKPVRAAPAAGHKVVTIPAPCAASAAPPPSALPSDRGRQSGMTGKSGYQSQVCGGRGGTTK